MSLLSTVVLEAQLPCTPCTLWRLKYHVVTIYASRVFQRLKRHTVVNFHINGVVRCNGAAQVCEVLN